MFRLETFGGLVVVDEAGCEVATQPRRLALLALLAVAGARGLTRAKVQAYLWPESSAESARHGLEQLLYYLRRQLTPDAFLGQDPLHLNPQVITSDVADFEHALACGALADAAALYRGSFLDGFFVNGAPGFERWVEEGRCRLAEGYSDVLRRLAEGEGARGRHANAIGWWRKLVASDPLSGRAALGLMRALVAAGDRPEAMLFARSYTALVRDELDAPVAPEVSAYVAELYEESPPQPPQVTGLSWPLPPATPVAGPPIEDGLGAAVAPIHLEGREVQRPRHLLALGVGVGAIVTIGTFATLGLRPTSTPPLDPNLVAVAPFDVLGSELDLWREGMVDLLSRGLDGAGPLRTVAPSVIIGRWGGRADQPSAAELARGTGASLAVYGSLLRTGPDSVRLSATLLDVKEDRVLVEVELRNAVNHMDRLVDSLAVRLLGELSLTRGVGLSRPARASSLPALKAFLRGEQYFRRMAWDSAQVHFERAVALDSSFALALRHLTGLQRWRHGAEDSLVRRYAFRAAAFNRGLPSRESLLVVADSLDAAMWLTPSVVLSTTGGDVRVAPFGGHYLHGAKLGFLRTARREAAMLEEAARRYPDDPEVWYHLGELRFHLGPKLGVTLREQLDAFDHAIALDSGFLQAEPHAVSLGIQLGGASLGRRYASAYLARNPRGDHAVGVRIVNALLRLPPLDSASLADWADSLRPGRALERAGEALGRWPDLAETGLRLVQSAIAPEGKLRDPGDRPRLALWLASRGHLREAADVLGSSLSTSRPHLFVDLALLGAIPAETAAAALETWLRGEELLSSLALPWWATQGDTITLKQVEHRADSAAGVSAQESWRRDTWGHMAEASRAYLALARRDTTEALRRFPSLPDSLCLECDYDRLQTAMLLAAARRDSEAYQRLDAVFPAGDIKEPPRPSETLWILERGRVAERLRAWKTAAEAYRWVVGMWRNADLDLQPYVADARAGLERLAKTTTADPDNK